MKKGIRKVKSLIVKRYGSDQDGLRQAYYDKAMFVKLNGLGIEYVSKHYDGTYTVRGYGISVNKVPYTCSLMDDGHFFFQYCLDKEEEKAKSIVELLNNIKDIVYEK